MKRALQVCAVALWMGAAAMACLCAAFAWAQAVPDKWRETADPRDEGSAEGY